MEIQYPYSLVRSHSLLQSYGNDFQHYFRKSISPLIDTDLLKEIELFIREYEKIYQDHQDKIEENLTTFIKINGLLPTLLFDQEQITSFTE